MDLVAKLIKKPRSGKLNRRAKIHNKKLALQRIIVEHRFAQMKVFQTLAQIYRNQLNSYRYKTAIIAGLVNMKNGFPKIRGLGGSSLFLQLGVNFTKVVS